MRRLMGIYNMEISQMLELCRSIKYEIRREQKKHIELGDNMRIRHEEELRKQYRIICRIEEMLYAQYRVYREC